MPERDYYEVLGIPRGATPDQIKSAYRKLAKQYHPDRNRNDKGAEAKFKEVQNAYDVLSDPAKRGTYDQFGHAGMGGGPGAGGWRAGPGGQRVYTWKSGGGPDMPVEDLDDLFSIFGGAGGRASGGNAFDEFFSRPGGRRRRSGPVAEEEPASARDIEHPISLTFEQAVQGTTLDLRLSAAGGDGPASQVSVKIPAGVADGQRIRVRGKGQPGRRGAAPGDLYIVCQVQPHRYFRRMGNDLYLELPITLDEAALGARIEIPTLDGTTVLTIPAGTPSGAKLRLKGKGVQPAGNKPRGDQYAVVRIVPPKTLTAKQHELFEQLRETDLGSPRKDLDW